MTECCNRAAIMYGVRDVRIEDVPMPKAGPNEVIVEVAAVGVCGSDIHFYRHGRIASYVVDRPFVLGHEAAGRVSASGTQAHRHALGTRVTIEPGVPCGSCRECRGGLYNLCRHMRFYAAPPVDGAFARYVSIHEDFAFPLPDAVSDEEGALIEPLAVGVAACRRTNVAVGDCVLVVGAGPIGLLTAQVAVAAGAARVLVTDINPARLEAAARLVGVDAMEASVAEHDVNDVDEFSVLVECSGAEGALTRGIRRLGPRGRAIAIGMVPSDEVKLTLSEIQFNEISITGLFRYANAYSAAIDLVAAGRVLLSPLITSRFSLEDTAAALEAGERDSSSIKSMVLPKL